MKTLIRATKHLFAHSAFRSGPVRLAFSASVFLFAAGAVLALPPRNVQAAPATLEDPKTEAAGSPVEKDNSEQPGDLAKEPRNDNQDGIVEEAGAAYYSSTPLTVSVNGSGPAPRALLVFSSNPEPKVRSQMQEDLAVMHHLLDKSLESSLSRELRTRNAMGVDLFFSPDSSHMQTAYFEGYGAFFLLRVDSPLLPPNKETQATEDSQPRNSAWEEAKQEVFGQPMIAGGGGSAGPSEPYNEEKVNRLKSSVLEALKNAANIRALKADEGVTICIIGSPKPAPGAGNLIRRQMGRMGQSTAVYTKNSAGSEQRSTVLTVRAKKADIDAFANGKMNSEEFRRRAAVSVYEGEPQTGMGFATFGVGAVGGGYGGSYNVKK